MKAIEPEMVLGKTAIGGDGVSLGEVVDVGLFSQRRVKFLVIEDKARRLPIRMISADAISSVSIDGVHVRTP